jgi:hypothetical protein
MDNNFEQLNNYLLTKYSNPSDYKIIGKNIYSKTAVSLQTIMGINEIIPIKVVFYLSINSYPYKKGYKLGILLDV